MYTSQIASVIQLDPTTGATTSTIELTTDSGPSASTPSFGAKLGYVTDNSSLYALDPTTGSKVWSLKNFFCQMVAVTPTSVFAVSTIELQVLDALTGAEQWRFSTGSGLACAPVIANGYVYVPGTYDLTTLDLANHTTVDKKTTGGCAIVGAHRVITIDAHGEVTAYALSE